MGALADNVISTQAKNGSGTARIYTKRVTDCRYGFEGY